MKAFEFPLQSVLQYQGQQRKQAELRQQQAQADLQRARGELAALQRELAETGTSLRAQKNEAVYSSLLLEGGAHLDKLEQRLAAARQRIQEAENKVAQANELRKQTAVKEEATELLREGQWRQHDKQTQRAAQEQVDEIAMQRWRRNDDCIAGE